MRNKKKLNWEIRDALNDEEEKFFPFATKGNIRYLKENMIKNINITVMSVSKKRILQMDKYSSFKQQHWLNCKRFCIMKMHWNIFLNLLVLN